MVGVFGLNRLQDAGQIRALRLGVESGGVVRQSLRAHERGVGQRGAGGQLPELAVARHGQQGEYHPENHQHSENKIQGGRGRVGFHTGKI